MKKENLLEVAEALFADKGYEGTSVRDIAQKAKVNVAMISYYFGSKEKMLEALIEFRNADSFKILEKISADTDLGPKEKIERIVDYYVDRILSNQLIHNIMTRQLSLLKEGSVCDKMIDFKMKNLEQIRKIILEGQKKKVFRNVDIEMTISTLVGTISQITMSKYLYCRLAKINFLDNDSYTKKIKPRVKKHLKSMLLAHLDIKNK
ncbi:MAG TPA: TetR family transcriptional regulator [Bacteroidia bacterium]|nr:TetR family transcriptional regulator [Bacteroidia bacterium]